MHDEAADTGLDLRGVMRVLRRRLPVLLACVVLVPLAAVVASLLQEDRYTAKATLLFRDPQIDQTLFGSNPPQTGDPTREAATNVQLVSLDVVMEETAKALGGSFTRDSVRDAVEISGAQDADLVTIEATDSDPEMAARIANTFAAEYIEFRRRADRQMINETTRLVERRLAELSSEELDSPTGRVLRKRLEELEILASLQTGNVEQVQVAEPPSERSAPQPMRNGVIGVVLGLMLGIGAALLMDRLDRRLRDPEEAAEIFERPILTLVPEAEALADPDRPLPAAVAEAFRMLRANLRYFNVDSDVRSVIVTSAQPGDGKSTVAWKLASATAATRTRVLLIEADLRRPTLSRWMHQSPRVGLSALLSGQATLADAVTAVRLGEGNGSVPEYELDVIFAGALPPNPDELMESEQMRELLRKAEGDYELVVIDTPPTSFVADAIPLLREASGVLVVIGLDRTSRDAARHLAEQLRNLNARVLGVVINHLRVRGFGYGYGYGYGYYGGSAPGRDGEGQKPEGQRALVRTNGAQTEE
jgi:capsular exopolysaccharide synthesis family protein